MTTKAGWEDTYELAKWLHETYEDKARVFKWVTQEKTRVPFNELPPENAKTMLAVAKEIKDILKAQKKELLGRLPIEKYEGQEQPDCGDPACPCGGYKFTDEEYGYNQAKDELIAFKKEIEKEQL